MARTNNTGIDFAGDADEFAADIGSVMTYLSVECTGVPGAATKTRDVDETGILTPVDLEWLGVVADFTAGVPGMGKTVDVDGVNYYVETRTYNEDETVVRFGLRRV